MKDNKKERKQLSFKGALSLTILWSITFVSNILGGSSFYFLIGAGLLFLVNGIQAILAYRREKNEREK
ncbi:MULTISPECIES: hypothetical protein [unclassified Lactococcus]|uniref:hypothetical protein n=1 Tax=unclassified Lactococcus TaxID=2643510 RepID=UPI0011C85DBF|nr:MULTISPECIES: hypothetical protein [unclassified Lactococcus]MQW22553.1 hypothetical protein [Lactococcus sp. dk101]TXK45576.1 hypothetical protein FVP42_01170 [Lactococcus sp. dk310]TXK51426.1 hypothetical protein FVP43_01175 [Lactococcus sp. dk322]